jgi:hypothetical protein
MKEQRSFKRRLVSLPADFHHADPIRPAVKITVGVSQYHGERIAKQWDVQRYDVVDAFRRAAKQIETKEPLDRGGVAGTKGGAQE